MNTLGSGLDTMPAGARTYCPCCDETFAPSAGLSQCPEDGTHLVRLGSDLLDPLLGQVLGGRYRMDRRLGQGGMGTVYQGTQLSTGRKIAIKVIEPGLTDSEMVIKRFLRECTLTSRLTHPGSIQVIDFAQDDAGPLFLVMELVEGQTLAQAVSAGALPLQRCLDIALQVAQVLEAAHAQGIIHRDLKPANIMLRQIASQEQVVVLDFGLATALESNSLSHLTASGAIMGTPAYIAPELAKGEQAGQEADFYALGVMLYEMATGVLPFTGSDVRFLLYQHVSEPPPMPDLPSAFTAILMRLLAKEPSERYSSASKLCSALRGVSEALKELAPTRAASLAEDGAADTLPAFASEIEIESSHTSHWWKAGILGAAAVALGGFYVMSGTPKTAVAIPPTVRNDAGGVGSTMLEAAPANGVPDAGLALEGHGFDPVRALRPEVRERKPPKDERKPSKPSKEIRASDLNTEAKEDFLEASSRSASPSDEFLSP